MTRYGRYIHCEVCDSPIYEGEFFKVHDGLTHCEECYTELVKSYLYDEYIPNHIGSLMCKAEEEMRSFE